MRSQAKSITAAATRSKHGTLSRGIKIMSSGRFSFHDPSCGCGNLTCSISKTKNANQLSSVSWSFSGHQDRYDPHLQRILDNNRHWIQEKKKEDPEFFSNLSKIHSPKYLYIGCSDSRLPVHQILGLK